MLHAAAGAHQLDLAGMDVLAVAMLSGGAAGRTGCGDDLHVAVAMYRSRSGLHDSSLMTPGL
jgi:hypothetical protein